MSDNLPAVVNNALPFARTIQFEYDGERYQIMNNKLFRGTDVAVVFSPGYGGGWTTWNENVDATDARVAVLTLTGAAATLTFKSRYGAADDWPVRFAGKKFYPYGDSTMSDDLAIYWLPQGTLYRITEYDGFESIECNYDVDWHIA